MIRLVLPALVLVVASLSAPLLLHAQPTTVDSSDAAVGADRVLRSTSIDESELELYPVANVSELIDLQPGVVDGHVRGGRPEEIGFYFGRFPINNPYFNRATFEVEPNMLSALHVQPGMVDSRYGYGMSGVVLMEPIRIPDRWTAAVLGFAGAFASTRELEFLQRESDSGPTLDLADFENSRITFNDAAGTPAQRDFRINAGGPVIPGRLGVVVAARALSREGHMLGRRLFMPDDGILAFSGRPRSEWLIRSSGDESFVQLGGEDRLTLSGRVNVLVMPELELTYDGIYQSATRHPYDHEQKYVPDGTRKEQNRALLHALQLVYGAGSSTRAWGHYAFMGDRRTARLFETPTDSRYVVQGPGNGANAFDAGGNDLTRSLTEVGTHMASIAAAHRFQRVHEIRGGVEARIHQIERTEGRVEVVPGTGARLSANPLFSNEAIVTPSELSAFAGVTLQIDRLTVDAGLRSSYFDPAAQRPLDWSRATDAYIPNLEGTSFYDPEEGDSIRNRQDASVKSWVSPRVELSFPITPLTKVRFGAGILYQMPALHLLYENLEYEPRPNDDFQQAVVFSNPDLEPERTLHIEMGVEHQLSENLGAQLALFGKDIKDITGFAYSRDVRTNIFVMQTMNTEIAEVRGATLSLFGPSSEDAELTWSLDYSLLFVEGTASSTPDAFLRFVAGLDDVRSSERLDWDRRHVIHNSIVWRPTPLLTVTLLNRLQSPLPYRFAMTNRPEYVVAGDDTPVQLLSDIRVWYDVPVLDDAIRLFVQVDNLTDARISRSVLSGTGTATDLYERGRHVLLNAEVEGVNTLQEYADDRFYLPPRTISAGLALRF